MDSFCCWLGIFKVWKQYTCIAQKWNAWRHRTRYFRTWRISLKPEKQLGTAITWRESLGNNASISIDIHKRFSKLWPFHKTLQILEFLNSWKSFSNAGWMLIIKSTHQSLSSLDSLLAKKPLFGFSWRGALAPEAPICSKMGDIIRLRIKIGASSKFSM